MIINSDWAIHEIDHITNVANLEFVKTILTKSWLYLQFSAMTALTSNEKNVNHMVRKLM